MIVSEATLAFMCNFFKFSLESKHKPTRFYENRYNLFALLFSTHDFHSEHD